MSEPPNNLPEILQRAVITGELVSIIYHGGSQPGTVREIRPVKVSTTEVWAYDDTLKLDGTEQAKKFVLSKIEIPVSDNSELPQYDLGFIPVEDARSIKDIFETKIAELQLMGWFVQLSENEIALHYYFKNGKIRKSAAVVLRFEEFITDLVFDEEWIAGPDGTSDFVKETRKSKRPYHVVSPTYHGSGFAKLSHAATVFFHEVEKHRSTNC